jgi:hypothetical protein
MYAYVYAYMYIYIIYIYIERERDRERVRERVISLGVCSSQNRVWLCRKRAKRTTLFLEDRDKEWHDAGWEQAVAR